MNLSKRLAMKILIGMLSVSMLTVPAFAVTGTVDANGGLRLRNGASTSAAILTTLPNGATVEVTGVAETGWYQIVYQGVSGFVSNDYLVVSEEDQASLETVREPVYGKVTDGPLNVRSAPSTSGDKLDRLSAGTVVQLLEELDGWYKIEAGYICADYVEIVDSIEAVSSGKGAEVVAYAKQFLGCRYVYGGKSPNGFDCSGFTGYIFSHFGINIGFGASGQLDYGTPVSDLQPGDLVFFKQNSSSSRATHVGLYIGNGEFIHASSPSTGVIISRMDSHTGRGYIGARRLV